MINSTSPLSHETFYGKVILNIDDNDLSRLLLSKILENAGLKTVSAENGMVAIGQLENGLQPDLILLDLDMPGLHGLAVAQIIRNRLQSSVPIIVNSGSVSDVEKMKLKFLKVTEYLEKPYSTNDIFSKINACLQVVQKE